MSEISMYEAQKKKMEGLCDEHELTYKFAKNGYPITFTIRPAQGFDAQLSMLENVEEIGYRSPDASMTWIFEDGILCTKVTGGTFTISKVLRTKIETVLMKIITYWQQYFFRDVIEKASLRRGMMPVIDETDRDDKETKDTSDGGGVEVPEDDAEVPDLEDPEAPDLPDLDDADPDFQKAVVLVRAENKASASLLQQRLNIGYAKAAKLLDVMEEQGVIGPYNGSAPREVLPFDEPGDGEDNMKKLEIVSDADMGDPAKANEDAAFDQEKAKAQDAPTED